MACAQVAKFFGCSVLSSDSDFFLFDIPGYIDLNSLLIDGFFDKSSDIIEMFHRKSFCRHHFSQQDLLFLFPSLVGNGVHPPTGHLIDQRKRWNAFVVDEYISNNLLTNLPVEAEENFKVVKQYYNGLIPVDPQRMLHLAIPKCSKSVPEWFQRAYRAREIPFMLFDALVNRVQHHSRCAISERIRQCCYTILGIDEVTEYRCTRFPAIEVKIKCIEEIPGHVVLEEIVSDEDNDMKRRVLYFALKCEQNAAQLDALSAGERLFMCTVIFWRFKARPPNNVIKALLACFVRFNTAERQEVMRIREKMISGINQGYQLLLVDWQLIYRDALVLFLLLRYRPATAPCPSRMYDEKIILSLAAFRRDVIDSAIMEFLLEKYRNMLQIFGIQ
jgi:hypothetical protein